MEKKKELAPLLVIVVIILGLLTGSLLKPDAAFSSNENRYLQQAPRLTWETLMSGEFTEDAENYMADQILLRDFWMESKSILQKITGKEDVGGIYIGREGRYFAKVTEDEFNQKNFTKNLKYIRTFFDRLEGKNCHILLAPTPGTILDSYLPKYAELYDAQSRYAMVETLFPNEIIDVRNALSTVSDPYYHTDHHWTTMGANAAYELWCQMTGREIQQYELQQVSSSFHGTLYSKALLPDSVYDSIYIAPMIEIESMDCDGQVSDCLYDYSKLEQKDHYEVFMGGNWAKVVLKTKMNNGQHLLIIKDSFANSFIPFLCNEYETITVVDLRHCREDVEVLAEDADDILVLYEMTNFADDGNVFKTVVK